jgi:hypothetical protein
MWSIVKLLFFALGSPERAGTDSGRAAGRRGRPARLKPRQHIPLQNSVFSTHRHYIAPLKWRQMAIILIQ